MSQLTDLFSNIANAIRGKTGNADTISAADFPTAISNIPATNMISGTITAKQTNNLVIPDAIGKENCIAVLMGPVEVVDFMCTWANSVNGRCGNIYNNKRAASSANLSWHSENGTFALSGSYVFRPSNYFWIAW